MALHDSQQNKEESSKQKRYKYLYVVIFMAATSATAVMLSIGGHISLDPLTAFVASVFAGFAFLIFQSTYVRFVVNSSRTARRKEQQPDLQ